MLHATTNLCSHATLYCFCRSCAPMLWSASEEVGTLSRTIWINTIRADARPSIVPRLPQDLLRRPTIWATALNCTKHKCYMIGRFEEEKNSSTFAELQIRSLRRSSTPTWKTNGNGTHPDSLGSTTLSPPARTRSRSRSPSTHRRINSNVEPVVSMKHGSRNLYYI